MQKPIKAINVSVPQSCPDQPKVSMSATKSPLKANYLTNGATAEVQLVTDPLQ